MNPLSVVEHFYILKDFALRICNRGEVCSIHQLLLQCLVEGFHSRVVVWISPPAHALDKSQLGYKRHEPGRGVLAALIGMYDHSCGRILPSYSLKQCFDYQFVLHPRIHGPADYLAAEDIQEQRQLEVALLCGDNGDVTNPYFIRPLSLSSRKEVLFDGEDTLFPMVPVFLPASLRIQSFGSHNSCDAFVVHDDTIPFQHLSYPGGSITTTVLMENLGDEFCKSFVLCRSFAFGPSEIFVEPTARNIQYFACLPDGVSDLIFLQESVSFFFSPIKKTCSCFNNSFSICNTEFSCFIFASSYSKHLLATPFPGKASTPYSSNSFTHLRRVFSWIPNSSETCEYGCLLSSMILMVSTLNWRS